MVRYNQLSKVCGQLIWCSGQTCPNTSGLVLYKLHCDQRSQQVYYSGFIVGFRAEDD